MCEAHLPKLDPVLPKVAAREDTYLAHILQQLIGLRADLAERAGPVADPAAAPQVHPEQPVRTEPEPETVTTIASTEPEAPPAKPERQRKGT